MDYSDQGSSSLAWTFTFNTDTQTLRGKLGATGEEIPDIVPGTIVSKYSDPSPDLKAGDSWHPSTGTPDDPYMTIKFESYDSNTNTLNLGITITSSSSLDNIPDYIELYDQIIFTTHAYGDVNFIQYSSTFPPDNIAGIPTKDKWCNFYGLFESYEQELSIIVNTMFENTTYPLYNELDVENESELKEIQEKLRGIFRLSATIDNSSINITPVSGMQLTGPDGNSYLLPWAFLVTYADGDNFVSLLWGHQEAYESVLNVEKKRT